MGHSTELDERRVEEVLREILDSLDRQLTWAVALMPLVILTIVPVVFFLLWHTYDWRFVRAAPTSAGLCCAFAAGYLIWVMLASRLARWRFDHRFPAGTHARALALRILAEMESPSKAEQRLLQALAGSSPDRIIRHRRIDSDTEPAETLLGGPSTVVSEPPKGQVQIGGPSGFESQQPSRPGGYYDYIPLEPRSTNPPKSEDPRSS